MTTTDENPVPGSIYADESMAHIDIGAVMRVGHPDVAAGDQHILGQVRRLRERLDRPLRIIDVGSGSGDLSLRVARHLPDCTVVANEIESAPVEQARQKLADHPNARVFAEPFERWTEPVDVVISWGTHHHLPHDYLDHVRELLAEDGVLIVGDEFCPEYLVDHDRRRLDAASHISVVDGYVFTDEDEVERYRATSELPAWSLDMEQARRRALWEWYKFVGDFAVSRASWDVLIAELQIARDDLVTGFAGEHKTSPYLLERELVLEGFAVDDKTEIGNRPVSLQSFVVFTARPLPR